MDNFAAIDFETANGKPTSVCSVGIVIVKDGEVTDKFYSLIHPEPNYYGYYNTKVHGLTEEDTKDAHIFPEVWKLISPKLKGLCLVAHNKGFDENCLKKVFKTYDMDYPDYEFCCTYQGAKKKIKDIENYKLNTVAAYCGYNMVHHHEALDDAYACAIIAMKIL